MAGCQTHRSLQSSGMCRSCLLEFCEDCLVYSYGRAKAPYCVRCALEAAAAPPAGEPRTPAAISA
jgi:hypothetical protein